MLISLTVRNLALVEKAHVEFGPGLNVITGETGAGKSVLMGALGLVLGERSDKSLVRDGEAACTAEAAFQLHDTSVIDRLLADAGLLPCEDGLLVIRRSVKTAGGGSQSVNDSPATVNLLRTLGDQLVDMHGPYDHQSLLNPDTQLEMLDAFGGFRLEREACAELYELLLDTDARIAALQGGDDSVADQIDLLSYKVKEIEEAEFTAGEEEKLRAEHQVVGNAQRILELGQAAVAALQDGEVNAFDLLAQARKSVESLSSLVPESADWAVELRQVATANQAIAATIRSRMESIEGDPARLDFLDQRLALYAKLRKKYGPDEADVLRTLEQSRARLKDLSSRGEQMEKLQRERASLHGRLVKIGGELRTKRAAAVKKMSGEVVGHLRDLGFAHGAFEVRLNPVDPGRWGVDAADFGFAPNAGESMRPLRAIASSGEIARVMLALKTVLADHDRIPLMVFDEIDANVGGEMGNAIGQKLHDVAKHHQVVSITHLPTAAVFGDRHFQVSKSVRDGRTLTQVAPIEGEARVEEVARMLGGKDLTDVTLEHARALLAKRQPARRGSRG